MIGNIWVSSALIVVTIFSTGAMYKSYSDIQEAKQIQEHYETIKDIKSQIVLRYNLDPSKITKDDIISHLPKGENWEKILFIDRKDSSTPNKEFLISNGEAEISKDEKLKVLALKAKLKDIFDTSNLEEVDNKYKIKIGVENQNRQSKQQRLDESVKRAINFLYQEIVINSGNLALVDGIWTDKNTETSTNKDKLFFYYTDIEYIFDKTGDDLISAQKYYLKQKTKDELLKNSDSMKSALYEKIESKL